MKCCMLEIKLYDFQNASDNKHEFIWWSQSFIKQKDFLFSEKIIHVAL